VLDALSSGGCPNLQGLTVDANSRESDLALARAVESSYLSHITEMELQVMFFSGAGLRFFEAIKQGGLPQLQILTLKYIVITQTYGQTFAEALGLGACPQFKRLVFESDEYDRESDEYDPPWRHSNEGLVNVLEGVGAGCCCAFESLTLASAHLDWASARARLDVFSKLSELKMLDLTSTPVGDKSMAKILERLACGCPKLAKMGVYKTGMGSTSGHVLVEALSNDAWPLL